MATLTPRVPADDVDAAPPQRRRRVTPPGTVLLVAAGGVFTAFLDATIVNTIFPEIEETFRGSSIGALSWVFNAYSIVTAALLIPAGRLADALGRRRVFRIGTVVFTLGSILCAVAPSLEVLVGARVVQAIGGAALIPTSLALVLDAFPGTTRAHGIAMWSAAAAIAAGVGPAVGGVLVELSGWRLAFLVNLPIGVLIYVATGRTIVESRAPGRRIIPDLAGSLILATSIGALVLAITKVNDWGLGSAPLIATAIAALGLLALFVQRTGRHRAPLFDLELFRIPAFSCANLLMVLAAIAYYAYLLCNVLFLTSVWGYSVLEAGLALTPGPFVAAAISRRFAVVTQRHGFTASLVIGASIWGLGVLWMITRVGTEPAFVAEWLPGMVILGVGAGATFPALSGVAIAAAPDASFATSTALNSVARQLGAALGIALLVAIVGTPGPADLAGAFDRGWALAAAMFALVVAGASTVRRVRQLPDAPAEALRAPFVSALAPLTVTAGAGAVGRLSAFFTEATAPRTETVADVLGRAEWFEELPRRAITELAGLATSRVVAPGDPVHVAGDAARHVLVIRSGRVQVATGDGSPMELGRGAVLGMVTALSRTLHADTVVALRETELIVLDREDLFRVSREVPVAGPRLLTMVSRRLAEAQRAPARTASPATVALVPIDLSVDVRAFAARLSDACGRLGSVGLLDGSEREVGPGQRVADVFGPVLARSERDVDRTLLVAGPDPHTPWTAFCLQHADRVLAVATPRTTAIAEPAQLIGCDLVLLGEGTSEPSLREALLPRATHRIGSDPGDLDRLARRLAGRSLGVVLSGGGARAFAHVGVLSELAAAGIEVDRVGGCSMGSYIGALLASGLSPQEIDAECYDHWVRGNPVSDWTLPRTALIRGTLMERMLAATFGEESRIEDLPRPFYCVSVDIRAQELVVHRDGNLWRAIGASLCLPVIAPPRVVGRQLLIDGGLMNNLPVDIMAADGEGPVLAIDIKPESGGTGGDGRRVPTRPPPMMSTLGRVLLLASANTSQQAALYADKVIEVRVGAVGLLEFHQIDQAIAAGAAAARAALEEGMF